MSMKSCQILHEIESPHLATMTSLSTPVLIGSILINGLIFDSYAGSVRSSNSLWPEILRIILQVWVVDISLCECNAANHMPVLPIHRKYGE